MADLNLDGKADLVLADYYTSTVSVLLGEGNGSFGAPVSYAVAANPNSVAVGDFNGDHIPDVGGLNRGNQHSIDSSWGREQQIGTQVVFPAVTLSSSVVTADFNGDGVLDLAVGDGGASDIAVLVGVGDGTFRAPQLFPQHQRMESLRWRM